MKLLLLGLCEWWVRSEFVWRAKWYYKYSTVQYDEEDLLLYFNLVLQ